ncbi:hypothetical protein D9Q98_003926 [Chlorella vulgaris]|uniref:Uncharacterized protein n=1 Tax=Chlorella vulgaris TaxID=3077 RepID=A0A9D4YXM0_CHLVU|nr:hypothetical protein D9Q98_003926 [Chlorella vulgaris]
MQGVPWSPGMDDGTSAAALEARYEPIDEVYTLQPVAVERRGIIAIIGSKCYVAAAAVVERLLDERDRQQQQQQPQDAPPPLERVVEAPEPWRQFDPLNCLMHRMMAACAGSCGPAGPQRLLQTAVAAVAATAVLHRRAPSL